MRQSDEEQLNSYYRNVLLLITIGFFLTGMTRNVLTTFLTLI